jgi:hypothetical protein
MPTLGVQDLLLKQEHARIEQRSRDAWKRDNLATSPVKHWLRTLGRPTSR